MAEPNAINDETPKLTKTGMELDKSVCAAELELVPALAVDADSTMPDG
jgi:hypothetical protein